MIYVINNSNSCFFNHAAEEYLMNKFDDEIFMLWVNKPSILIGRNQNTLSEINYDYITDNKIDIVRRLSGGGAVYNDLGNMNFSFITYRNEENRQVKNGFEKFALPVINALQSLGVNAIFTGRNDITIDGKKFSGNAQYFQKDKLLHHGTLLFDCDMTRLSSALKSKALKFKDKGIKSVGGRVTNILPHLREAMTLEEFREYLKNYIIDAHNIERVIEFNENDIEEIEKISKERFETWEWNYGKCPVYTYENSVKYPSGLIEYNLNVEESIITDISIYGDFFGERNIKELESALIGVKHNKDELENCLNKIEIDKYIKGLTVKELVGDLLEI
ncbi:lipoate--protein ligase [Tissierella creatinophila]|uniref:lipoate--protein ligase n=1 Tax=Tissierella creatinophila DSM 6911 TaxID=1123403 RepID=A0A1U7M764_TISCR|nr:lipoate--protein ligase [Tissierella creatinophila]OLS03137.1 lipoate-protein ligase LplJ [Tissierella creatinophila DSM 6911]